MNNDGRVIVVGAGPTGLALAAELALAGVPCTVLEKRRDAPNVTRAGPVLMAVGFAHDLARFGPGADYPPPGAAAARAYCRAFTRRQSENFSVATLFLPRPLLAHFDSVYAYSVTADADNAHRNPVSNYRCAPGHVFNARIGSAVQGTHRRSRSVRTSAAGCRPYLGPQRSGVRDLGHRYRWRAARGIARRTADRLLAHGSAGRQLPGAAGR